MKKAFFLVIVLFSTYSLFAQVDERVKDLSKFNIVIQDNAECLNSTRLNKLISEIKVKLISLGLKFSEDESAATFVVETNIILSKFSDHRVHVQFYILENATVHRKSVVTTMARTYHDQKFFVSSQVGTDVYNVVMDEMVVRLVDLIISSR
jgi:hypothetical protein